MPFFLLARADDGAVRLLSSVLLESRNEALAELSRVTADPAFDRWDDEVYVFDADSGTQVLMVRPATAEPEPAQKPEPAEEPEVVEEEQEVAQEPEIVEEPEAADAEPEVAEEPEAETDDEIAAVIEGLDQDDDSSLKDALKRTAVALESEGIIAPESVGPAEPQEADDAPMVDEEGAASDSPAAWPWDTAPSDRKFDLDAPEVPRDDEASLVRAPGDDETMSFAKPVILGSEYADTGEVPDPAEVGVNEPASLVTPSPEPPDPTVNDPAVVETVAEEPVEEPAPEIEPEAPTPDPFAPAQVDSDFIELSDPVASQDPQPVGEAVPGQNSVDLGSLTCEECVYAETCPNRGQLLPASCGSFQWK